MKRIQLSPYIKFGLLTVFCVFSGLLILRAISQVNFEYVHSLASIGAE